MIKYRLFKVDDTQITSKINKRINNKQKLFYYKNNNTQIYVQQNQGIVMYNPDTLRLQFKKEQTIYRKNYNLNIVTNNYNKSQNITWDDSKQYTYFTTVGLYDKQNNLIAIARVNRPIKLTSNKQITIKFPLQW